MSWLLSKVTGGLLGGGGAPKTPEKADAKYDEPEDDEDDAEAAAPTSDEPVDYSSLTFPSHDELCRASITFSRWMGEGVSLSVKSRHALLVLLRLPKSYDSELRVYLSADKPVIVTPVTGELWYDVVKAQHALMFGVVQSSQRLFFHCLFHDEEEEKTAVLNLSVAVWEHAQQDSFTKSVKQTKWYTHSAQHSTAQHTHTAAPHPLPPLSTLTCSLPRLLPLLSSLSVRVDPMEEEYHEAASSQSQSSDEQLTFMEDDDPPAADDEDDDDEPEVTARHATPIRGFRTTRPRTLKSASKASAGANDKLAVGIAVNRAFVGRGDMIGVFSHDDKGKLEFQTTLAELKDTKGQRLLPSQMMLHEKDRKMILVDSANHAYEMDIEAGKVVQEFQPMKDVDFAVRSVGHVSKYAERTDEPLVLGVNKNAVFSLDSRAHGQVAHKHQYASAMGMNSVVSNGEGAVATGSEKGEIRLYNDINKVAKTRLPGLGDPIIGLDTTEDGKWSASTPPLTLSSLARCASAHPTPALLVGCVAGCCDVRIGSWPRRATTCC